MPKTSSATVDTSYEINGCDLDVFQQALCIVAEDHSLVGIGEFGVVDAGAVGRRKMERRIGAKDDVIGADRSDGVFEQARKQIGGA
jgi:hypothetical protein